MLGPALGQHIFLLGGEDGEFLDLGQIAIEARFTTGGGDSRRNLAAACHIRLILPAPHVILRGDTCLLYNRKSNTSELQSLMRISYAVFCLKKKKTHTS